MAFHQNSDTAEWKDTLTADLGFYHAQTDDLLSDKQQQQKSGKCHWKATFGRLYQYDLDQMTECMSICPTNITRIKESEKKFLCVRYGPAKTPLYFFLNFTDSGENMEDWEKLLRKMMGKNITDRRKSSPFLRQNKRPRLRRQAMSAAQLYPVQSESYEETPSEDEPSATGRNNEEGPEIPEEDQLKCHAIADNAQQETLTTEVRRSEADNGEDMDVDISDCQHLEEETLSMSQPGSLRSQEGDDHHLHSKLHAISVLRQERDLEYVDVECQSKNLRAMELTLGGHDGGVFVSSYNGPRTGDINIGDKIIAVNDKTTETTKAAMSLLCNDASEKIKVRLQRFPNGNLCEIHDQCDEWSELGVKLRGNQIVSMMHKDGCDAFRSACDPSWVTFEGSRSGRSITGVNEQAVPHDATTSQVTDMIKDALREVGPTVIHVHPTAFLQKLHADMATKL